MKEEDKTSTILCEFHASTKCSLSTVTFSNINVRYLRFDFYQL